MVNFVWIFWGCGIIEDMTTLQIILQIIPLALLLVATFQKEKWKMMFWSTVTNAFYAVMYFSFGRIATAAICIVAGIRTLTYMIFAIKKLKPNWIVLVVFEAAFIAAAIITWQDALDLMPLFALISVCYGTWQDNQLILRISYIINHALVAIYQLIIMAYITMFGEIVLLISTIVCLIYYCILKKERPLLSYIIPNKKKDTK